MEELTKAKRYQTPGGRQFSEICETDLLTEDEIRGAYKYNALKYQIRYQKKGGIADLQKAKAFIDLLIEFEEKKAAENAEMRAYVTQ